MFKTNTIPSLKALLQITMVLITFFSPAFIIFAQGASLEMKTEDQLKMTDTDKDGLSDFDESNIYFTNPNNPDTDNDSYRDGEEVLNSYDPNKAADDKIEKIIHIDLKKQELTYSLAQYVIKSIKVSAGLPKTPTPKGQFTVIKKPAIVTYKGIGYFFPNTRWNMLFKYGANGGFYIHGAYWHNNFGKPMSHGCVNVSYKDMEPLYNWTDEGTKVIIE